MKTNHYGVEINSETPITGVIVTNAPEWLQEEIDTHGIDLEFVEHKAKCQRNFHDECYDFGADTTWLIGYKLDEKLEYVPDPNAQFSAIVNGGEGTAQITLSKFTSRAMLCSPCYPGQGDLDNSGEYLTYTLPPDIWGSHDHLPINEIDKTVEVIRRLYTGLYNTGLDTRQFSEDFFYTVGEILKGTKPDEVDVNGPAAEMIKDLIKGDTK